MSALERDLGSHALIRMQNQRRGTDQAALLGYATTRTEERLLAAVGVLLQAPVEFGAAGDVPLGGVLWALPALLAEGLRACRLPPDLPTRGQIRFGFT
jgi:hypothetical protein